jgi:hypothetical protein
MVLSLAKAPLHGSMAKTETVKLSAMRQKKARRATPYPSSKRQIDERMALSWSAMRIRWPHWRDFGGSRSGTDAEEGLDAAVNMSSLLGLNVMVQPVWR